MRQAVFILIVMAGLGGGRAARAETVDRAPASSEAARLIAETSGLSMEESLPQIAPVLMRASVLLPGDSENEDGGTQANRSVTLLTARDKFGQEWFYAYTDEAELLKVFPEGARYVEMNFRDFLTTAESKPGIGGIFINSGSDDSYPIPKTFFSRLKQLANH